jgi:hypothetical protein
LRKKEEIWRRIEKGKKRSEWRKKISRRIEKRKKRSEWRNKIRG